MTDREEIMSLAIEIWDKTYWANPWTSPQKERLERFYHAAYLAGVKAERERSAAICRKEAAETDPELDVVIEALEDCADMIDGKKLVVRNAASELRLLHVVNAGLLRALEEIALDDPPNTDYRVRAERDALRERARYAIAKAKEYMKND